MAENIYEFYLEKGRERFAGQDLNKVADSIKDIYLTAVNYKLKRAKNENNNEKIEKFKDLQNSVKDLDGIEFVQTVGVDNENYSLISERLLADKEATQLDTKIQAMQARKDLPEILKERINQLQKQYELTHKRRDAVNNAIKSWAKMDDSQKLETKIYQSVEHIERHALVPFGSKIAESSNLSFLFENFFYDYNDSRTFVEANEKVVEEQTM